MEIVHKKMSGRWGDRPLGRGMEGTVIRSQFGFSGRSAALASSRTTHRSKQITTILLLQKAQPTQDYSRSLSFTRFSVDSSLGSFFPVLLASAAVVVLVRKYSSAYTRSTMICFTFFMLASSR